MNYTRTVLSILFFSIMMISFSSCQTQKIAKNAEPTIPENIIKVSDNYIKSIAGDEYFSKYISVDLSNSKKIKSFYEVVYKLQNSEKKYVDEPIRLYVTEKGKVDQTKEISGIPNCKKNPSEGIFNLDKKGAVESAAEYGIKEGAIDWKVEFKWAAEFDKYVWHILATYNQLGDENFRRGNGEEIFIDPFDGSQIAKREWKIR